MDYKNLLDIIKNYEIYLYYEIRDKCIFKPKNNDELIQAIMLYCNNITRSEVKNGIVILWELDNIKEKTGKIVYGIICSDYNKKHEI